MASTQNPAKYLNLGCGNSFHPAWINLDIAPTNPHVLKYDLRQNIPFADNTFEVVYHSHLLEHFPKADAPRLMHECFRVLMARGILRVVVPDLEGIARQYLVALEQAAARRSGAESRYDWMVLELYDQAVRTFRGGEMGRALARPETGNNEFIRSRMGAELAEYGSPRSAMVTESRCARPRRSRWLAQFQRWRMALCLCTVALIGGSEARAAFAEGLFRHSGEVHLWMYDRFSLQRLLSQAGFSDIRLCHADESCIPNYAAYALDITDGCARKPDSLYMEACKSP